MNDDRSALETPEAVRDMLVALVDGSDDAIVSKDLNGIIRSWNRGAQRLFGYEASEAIGRSVTILIPEDRQSEEVEILRRIRRGERVEHFESVRRRKNGELVEVSLTISPIHDGTGRVVGASKIARNIGERKRTEALNYSLAAIVDSSEDAIISKDLNGVIRTWNEAATRIFGYTAAEAVGQSIMMLIIPPDRRAEEHMILSRLRNGERVEHFSSVRRRKNGGLIEVSLTISPIKDPAGKVIGASNIMRDIAAQKRFERSLQEANRMKSEFLANMSHELRTPLNGIIGFTELLADERPGPLNAKQREYLEDVLSSGRHLLQLINDILDLAKVEAGRMELHPVAFFVRQAIAEVAAIIAPIALKKRIALEVDVAAELGEVVLDPQKFKQVLYNLGSNALKFTGEDGQVVIQARPAQNGKFQVAVRDTGIGMKPEDIDRLFVEFQQLDASSTRSYEGTGLGLALTRKIVMLQGGTIAVESEVGRGSTFTVTLPLTSVALENDGRQTSPPDEL